MLFLLNLDDPDNPIELAFTSKYGEIVAYKWYGALHLLFVIVVDHYDAALMVLQMQ